MNSITEFKPRQEIKSRYGKVVTNPNILGAGYVFAPYLPSVIPYLSFDISLDKNEKTYMEEFLEKFDY